MPESVYSTLTFCDHGQSWWTRICPTEGVAFAVAAANTTVTSDESLGDVGVGPARSAEAIGESTQFAEDADRGGGKRRVGGGNGDVALPGAWGATLHDAAALSLQYAGGSRVARDAERLSQLVHSGNDVARLEFAARDGVHDPLDDAPARGLSPGRLRTASQRYDSPTL